MTEICFTLIHRCVCKVFLLYFKQIQKKVKFISELLKCVITYLKTMLGCNLSDMYALYTVIYAYLLHKAIIMFLDSVQTLKGI
jgi:hypothetical protein